MGDKPTTHERDPITVEQGKILNDRESFYQTVGQPALLDFYNDASNFEFDRSFEVASVGQLAGGAINQANQQYGVQEDQLQTSLAKRGLSDSGVGAGTMNMLGNANAQQKAGIVNQAQQQTTDTTNRIMQMNNQYSKAEFGMEQQGLAALLGMSPQAVGGAPSAVPNTEKTNWLQALSGAAGGMLGGLGGSGGGNTGTDMGNSNQFGGGQNYGAGAPMMPQSNYSSSPTGFNPSIGFNSGSGYGYG